MKKEVSPLYFFFGPLAPLSRSGSAGAAGSAVVFSLRSLFSPKARTPLGLSWDLRSLLTGHL